MQIDENLLGKLEKLSALRITEKRNEIIQELSEIVNFVEKLNDLNLNFEEATINIIKGSTPLRLDEVQNNEVIDQILEHAPQTQGHFFTVPKIIE